MELLEYIIQLRGAQLAAAQVKEVSGSFDTLAASETRAGAAGDKMAAGTSRGAKALTALSMIGKAGALALVGIGIEAVKSATSFNHEMLRIRTDAGASTTELANMKKGVLELASSGASMGQGPMSLAEGLYHLESLGIRGAKALHALKLASQEAEISGANLEDTTSALGAAMFVGIKGTGNLTHLMGILNATVGAGNMRFQQLTEALGTGVLSSAKIAGLGIKDVSAALAVATDSGMQASSAGAQLATALHFLYAPGLKATNALESIHLGANRLGADMHKPQGLLVALRDLKDHLSGLSKVQAAQVLNEILPGGRGRILLTEMTMLDRLQSKYRQINKTAGGFGGSVRQQQQDPQTKLHEATARIQADLIRLGNVIGPVVMPAVTALVNAGGQLLEWLIKLPAAIKGVVAWFSNAGGAVGGLRDTASSAFSTIAGAASKLWDALKMAFSSIVTAARATFSGEFGHDLLAIGKAMLAFGATVFKVVATITRSVLPGLVTVVKGAFNIIAGVVKFVSGLLTLDFGKAWDGVKQIFGGAITVVLGIFKSIIGGIEAVGLLIINAIKAPFVAGFDLVKGVIVSGINWVIGQLNNLIDAFNSVAGSLPIIGGSLTVGNINPIGGPGKPSGAPAPGSTPFGVGLGAGVNVPGASGPAVHGSLMRRISDQTEVTAGSQTTGTRGGDVVINVGGHNLARIHRREIIKAMAAAG